MGVLVDADIRVARSGFGTPFIAGERVRGSTAAPTCGSPSAMALSNRPCSAMLLRFIGW